MTDAAAALPFRDRARASLVDAGFAPSPFELDVVEGNERLFGPLIRQLLAVDYSVIAPERARHYGRPQDIEWAVDRSGQSARSRVRTLKIDSIAPTLKVRLSGKRAAGKELKIAVKAKDAGGAGLDHVTVDYGDHSATSHVTTTRHRYKRGTFTLKVAAVDKAGNVARKQVKLRIKKS